MGLAPGDRFDRYTIEGMLGQGGMGRVFSAYDSRLKRRVAIKVLRAGPEGESTGGQARLLREAQAAASLDHPNVVAVFDVGEMEGEPFIVMELVSGRSLKSYVGDRSIPLSRRLGWLRDVAAALDSAHARGLVHRDVKPSNVMVRDDGVVKVFDFGIARVTRRVSHSDETKEGKDDTNTLSRKDLLIGTPRYMSPEQLRSETIDGRADQFAWGVLAYELVTGRLPWKALDQDVDLVAAILLQVVEPMAALEPDLPSAVEAIILRALAKEAVDRFPTMGRLVSALEPLLGGSSRDVADAARTGTRQLSGPPLAAARALSEAPAPLARPEARQEAEETHATKTAHSVAKPNAEAAKATPGRRSAPLIKGLALLAIAGAAVFAVRRYGMTSRDAAPAVSIVASSSASAAPRKAVTELTPPISDNPAAVTAYVAGLQALRDGANQVAVASFARALALDPQMAAAHMRLGIYTFYKSPTEARDHLSLAQQRRSTLSPRDAALLDALDAYIRRQPSDHEEYERRLRAAVERFPGDAELLMLLAYERAGSEMDGNKALAGYDAALAIDPQFGMAYAYKAQEQAYRDDFDGTVKTAEECRRAAPSATFCVHLRGAIEEYTGQCSVLEATARQTIALEPTSDTGYRTLAKAAYALGRPLDVVKTTLDQAAARGGEAGPATDSKIDDVSIHVLGGRFDAAERVARAMATAASGQATVAAHAKPAQLLVDIYGETGQDALAAPVADAFLRHRAAWTPDPRGEDFAVGRDPAPMMLAVLRRTGRLSAEAFASQREAWVSVWKPALLPMYVRYAWIHGYASVAAIAGTADEAKRALEALPSFGQLPRFSPRTLAAADIGRTYLLADRIPEALTWLKRATESCSALEEPILHTRAHLDLGIALERSGDRAGACRAYAVVLDRWGKAVPKSLTATRARERMKTARCGSL